MHKSVHREAGRFIRYVCRIRLTESLTTRNNRQQILVPEVCSNGIRLATRRYVRIVPRPAISNPQEMSFQLRQGSFFHQRKISSLQ